MKSLYESILSSTKAGRFAKLTEEHLEELGFDTKPEIISKKDFPFYIYRYHGRFYVKIQRQFSDNSKPHSIDTIRFYVDTIAEFEKVMAYWNAQIEDDYKEIEKTYKILKEKLKRF
jgi:hypothetical protein